MARRSLQASTEGIEKAKKAFKRKDWTQEYLAAEVGLETRQPVWKFFTGRAVERHIFMELCFQLNLDWQEIVGLSATDKHEPDKDGEIDALVQKVRSHRWDKIQAQCSATRLLDIARPVKLNDIYVNVNILEVPQNQNWLDVSYLPHLSLEEFDNANWSNSQERVLGLEAVSTYTKLMILGKPGSGKTTFLQHIALQCSQGTFQPEQVPIFIRLRNFIEGVSEVKSLSLSSYIYQELCSSDISEQQAETLLRQGKALILLDGLDEVPEKDNNEVLKQIRQFSEEYYKNQLVITCRTAAQQYQFEGFTDIEIADFDQAQIEAFVHKWFVSVGRNSREKGLAKAAQFMQNLQLSENWQIRELATTPLLLHLACSIFQAETDFPAKRSDFFKQGLDILLFRLDEARGIKRDSPNLSLSQKFKLLSQIAAISFEKNGYFFKKSTLQRYIANYLRTLPAASSDLEVLQLESERVLRDIEAQHGLLVERVRGVYSFSHIMFQEHLTARNIISISHPQTLDQNLAQLAAHVNEPRWREVLLCTASILENADVLLYHLQERSQQLVADAKLQQFLTWLHQKSLTVQAPYKPAAVRAFYFTLAHEFTLARDFSLALALDPNLAGNPVPDLALDLALERILKLGLTLASNPSLNYAIALLFAFPLSHKLSCTSELQRSPLGKSLQHLKNQLPSLVQGEETLKVWWHANGKAWVEELRALITQYRNIGHLWKFSDQQRKTLKQFYESNQLLQDCLSSDCRVAPILREKIQETLLLPTGASPYRTYPGREVEVAVS